MMRLIAFTIVCSIAFYSVTAQIIINPGFEDWDTVAGANYEEPVGWKSSNSTSQAIAGLSVTKDTVAYSDSFAVQISSYTGGFNPQTFGGLLTNGSISNDSLGLNGDSISYKPATLSGYYKFSSNTIDSGLVVVYLNRYSSVLNSDEIVAGGSIRLGPASVWTYFEITIQDQYLNSPEPTSYVILATSTDSLDSPRESTLWLDELGFAGVLSSVHKELSQPEISCYPNPATNILYLNTGKHRFKYLQIFNAQGTMVKNVLDPATVNVQQLDVSFFPEGAYFIKGMTEKGANWSDKFTVIK